MQDRKVRQFVSSYGQKAKTDKVDAKMQETLRLYQQYQSNQLKELVSHREDLKGMLQKERNRKEYFDDKIAKRSIDTIVGVLQKQLEAIDQEIKERT